MRYRAYHRRCYRNRSYSDRLHPKNKKTMTFSTRHNNYRRYRWTSKREPTERRSGAPYDIHSTRIVCIYFEEKPKKDIEKNKRNLRENHLRTRYLDITTLIMITLRPEQPSDYRIIEELTRDAFWDLYKPGCDEHLVVHKMREVPAFVKELDLVACDGDIIVGYIMYSKAKVVNDKNEEYEVLCMGPLAVAPDRQKQGI